MPRQAIVPSENIYSLEPIDLDSTLLHYGFYSNIELGAYEKDFFSEDGYLSSYILVIPFSDMTEVWVESNDGRCMDQAIEFLVHMHDDGIVCYI